MRFTQVIDTILFWRHLDTVSIYTCIGGSHKYKSKG